MPFDIHTYGDQVVSSSASSTSGVLREAEAGQPAFEVCRSMLASPLQLVMWRLGGRWPGLC